MLRDESRLTELAESLSTATATMNQMTRPKAAQPENPFQAVSESAQRGIRATLLGLVVSVVLATVKLLGGLIGNSYALIADGVESLLDVFGALVVWASLRIAARPPNERYPYGFGRAESLATLVVALVLLVAGVGIAIQSVREILVPHHSPEPFTLVILVIVVAAKELMYRRLNHAGREIGSHALEADAWHHRSDALTSLAAFVGISIALIAGKGYEAADDWAALLACGVIIFNGVRLFRQALAEVMDVAVPPEVEAQVRQIAGQVDGVLALDKCRVRRTGLTLFVDIQVIVDANLSVRRGHEIGHEVKDVLLASPLSIVDVNVHVEPSR